MRGDIHGELKGPFSGLVSQDACNDFFHAGIIGIESQICDKCQFVEWLAGAFVACNHRSRPFRQFRNQFLHLRCLPAWNPRELT